MILTINNKDYNLNLTTRNCVELEKIIGHNPIEFIIGIADDVLPNVGEMAYILHAMLKGLNHGITLDDTYNLIDAYVKDGHTVFDLINPIITVFKECGYISGHSGEDEEEPKN